ncbi:hypothetical protein [Acinetobacter sp. NIPH 298]|uniref:hypothetical protein n=1 Tax=Acinetobacter sp. NIPH 298 TaxID=1217692 RepID=UPI0002CE0558|nr:hypothetical protein [Acinetobacter sp. NIPH 298]ENW95995.1 hypothetical protein F903_01763 [Acinetobacter sp. NIPH 298]
MNVKKESALKQYWTAYGGWRALLSSPYLWCAFLGTFFCYSFWTKEDFLILALSALPSLLGFSLGGYAVWLAIGDQRLKKMLSEHTQKQSADTPSDFMKVNATFVHFIILQIISLVYLIFLKANSFSEIILFFKQFYVFSDCLIQFIKFLSIMFYGLGFFLFTYSILSMLAATFAVFKIARWSDMLNRVPENK